VETCEPAIDGIDVLLSKLNDTNDFARFVQTMRRNFLKVVEQES
jgi:hypothetical protein